MVAVIDGTPTDTPIADTLPLVIELVGPAGAGKTTLSRMLAQSSERILVSEPPFVWSMADLPFFVRHGLPLVPTLLRLCQNHNGRQPTRREIAWMVILNGWHRVVRCRTTNDTKVVILDQGPIFLLTQLQEFGPERLRSHSGEDWWEAMYSQWADALDVVIYLDAPDPCLLQRIRTRDKWHLVKDKSASEVSQFLASYRVAYEKVLSRLAVNNDDLKVVAFDTAQESLDKVMDDLLLQFGLKDSRAR